MTSVLDNLYSMVTSSARELMPETYHLSKIAPGTPALTCRYYLLLPVIPGHWLAQVSSGLLREPFNVGKLPVDELANRRLTITSDVTI